MLHSVSQVTQDAYSVTEVTQDAYSVSDAHRDTYSVSEVYMWCIGGGVWWCLKCAVQVSVQVFEVLKTGMRGENYENMKKGGRQERGHVLSCSQEH